MRNQAGRSTAPVLGGALVTVAFGLQFADDGVRLHGDGGRTDDGEGWRAHLPVHLRHWFDPRSQRLPAMTPGSDPTPGWPVPIPEEPWTPPSSP